MNSDIASLEPFASIGSALGASSPNNVPFGICIGQAWAIFRISEAIQNLRIFRSPFRYLDNPITRFVGLTLGTFAEHHSLQPASHPSRLAFSSFLGKSDLPLLFRLLCGYDIAASFLVVSPDIIGLSQRSLCGILCRPFSLFIAPASNAGNRLCRLLPTVSCARHIHFIVLYLSLTKGHKLYFSCIDAYKNGHIF